MKYLLTAALVAWTYTQANGIQAWTDYIERVPVRYINKAERVEIGSLWDYNRTTVVVGEQQPVCRIP